MPASSKSLIPREAASAAPLKHHVSKLPAPLRFPLYALLAVTSSSLLYSLSAAFLSPALADLGRSVSSSSQDVGLLLAFRVLELAIAWYADFDGVDAASLILLTRAPTLYLLTSHYTIPSPTALLTLALDTLTTVLPLSLLRPLSAIHTPSPTSQPLYTRAVIDDLSVRAYTTLLGASIFAVTLYGSYATFLPSLLATRFDGLKDLSGAYTASLLVLVPLSVPLGWAAREVLFSPAQAAALTPDVAVEGEGTIAKIDKDAFDPATATLAETLRWNFWGWSSRTKTLVVRTAAVVVSVVGSTAVQTACTIEGVEVAGALGYAGVWGTAVGVVAAAYAWVGDV